MSTKSVTPVVSTNNNDNKASDKMQNPDTDVLVVSVESIKSLGLAFSLQDDFENESKFAVNFVELAVKSALKASCAKAIAAWDRAIDKYSKDHATMTREQIVNELLASKKMRRLKKLADAASEAKKTL